MNKDKFIAAGKAAFGERWQTDMAVALDVSDRAVRAWVAGKYQLPNTISADVKIILERRMEEIKEAIDMVVEKFLMNPETGSVDTEGNWLAEMPQWEESNGRTPQEQFDSLIEVVKDASGQWVEA